MKVCRDEWIQGCRAQGCRMNGCRGAEVQDAGMQGYGVFPTPGIYLDCSEDKLS